MPTDGDPNAGSGDGGLNAGRDRDDEADRRDEGDGSESKSGRSTAETTEPNPPQNLSTEVVETLRRLSANDLREAVLYGQELLQLQQKTAPRIEPRPGEEFVRVEDRDGYTLVVKREPCGEGCEDCPHGPYAYHVTEEKMPSGERRTRWTLIGRVEG
ncbi:hypothetical protein [Haloprofundus salinisoli]|uniref:hypothetical protein n=1 Tax=Haloprofundus salinisoli TaxID=2876193 RepID=UPI001CC95FDC|nr:hypothetical protein [Haloprofundus salinisoli]